MNKTVNNLELARRISKRHPEVTVKDVSHQLDYIQEEILYSLLERDEIKFGKLFKFVIRDSPQQKHYDGINKREVTLPARKVVKTVLLSKIKNLRI